MTIYSVLDTMWNWRIHVLTE